MYRHLPPHQLNNPWDSIVIEASAWQDGPGEIWQQCGGNPVPSPWGSSRGWSSSLSSTGRPGGSRSVVVLLWNPCPSSSLTPPAFRGAGSPTAANASRLHCLLGSGCFSVYQNHKSSLSLQHAPGFSNGSLGTSGPRLPLPNKPPSRLLYRQYSLSTAVTVSGLLALPDFTLDWY